MALIIKYLLESDTFETLIKKFNFNFDQIQSNGGGPIGLTGGIGGRGLTGYPGLNGTFWYITTDLTSFLSSSVVIENNDLILLTEPCTYLTIPYIKGDIFRCNVSGGIVTITHIGNIKPDIVITPTGTSGIFETIYNGIDPIYHRNATEMNKIPVMFATEDSTGTNDVLTQFRAHLIAGPNKSAAYIYGNDSTVGGGKLTFIYGIGTSAFTLDEITNAPSIQGTINDDKLSLLINSNHNIRNIFTDNYFLSDSAGIDVFSIIRSTAGMVTTNTTNIQLNSTNDNFNISSNTLPNIFTVTQSIITASIKTEWSNTDYIKIPIGTTLNRPTIGSKGMIRYNTVTNVYEAFINTWVPLQGVYDSNGNTYIDVDIPGDSDTMKFYTGGILAMQIQPTQRVTYQNHLEMFPYKGLVFSNQLWSSPLPYPSISEAERTLTDYRYVYNRTGMTARGPGGSGGSFYNAGAIVNPTVIKSSNTYNKVGTGVTFNLHLEFTITANMVLPGGGTTNGQLNVSYLPYAANVQGNYLINCAVEGLNIDSSIVQIIGMILSGSNGVINLFGVTNLGTLRPINLSDCNRTGGTNKIYMNGFYSTVANSYDDPVGIGPSDIRFKYDINKLQQSTERLMQLNGYTYFFKDKEFPEMMFGTDEEMGVIAQEVETVFPQAVVTDNNGYKRVKYYNLIPALIEGFKEQQLRINKLEELINGK